MNILQMFGGLNPPISQTSSEPEDINKMSQYRIRVFECCSLCGAAPWCLLPGAVVDDQPMGDLDFWFPKIQENNVLPNNT